MAALFTGIAGGRGWIMLCAASTCVATFGYGAIAERELGDVEIAGGKYRIAWTALRGAALIVGGIAMMIFMFTILTFVLAPMKSI